MSCLSCGENKGASIQQCGQCLGALYCSRECQVNHWPKHKLICKKTGEVAGAGVNRPKTMSKSETTEVLLRRFLDRLQSADMDLNVPPMTADRKAWNRELERRTALQSELVKDAFEMLNTLEKRAGLSKSVRVHIRNEAEKFEKMYQDMYSAALLGEIIDEDPLGPLQAQHDKIFRTMRLALSIPAPKPQDVFAEDEKMVASIISAVSVMAAGLAAATMRSQEKSEETALIETTWMDHFATYFRDATGDAAQATLRELVYCIWGRESYSEARMKNDPLDKLRTEHKATMKYFEDEVASNSIHARLGSFLLSLAQNLEDSQTEFRLHIASANMPVTPDEEEKIRQVYLAMEIALSVGFSIFLGYHVYTGWNSAVGIREMRKNALEKANIAKLSAEQTDTKAKADLKAKTEEILRIRRESNNCSQNVTALQQRELAQMGTLSVGFDMRLRAMAAGEFGTAPTLTRITPSEPGLVIANANNRALINRQDRLANEGIDAFSHEYVAFDTDPLRVTAGAKDLQDQLRLIDEVPANEIIDWTNRTANTVSTVALTEIRKDRETPNVPGNVVVDEPLAQFRAKQDEAVVRATLTKFRERLLELQKECMTGQKKSAEVLDRSIALLNVLARDPRTQGAVLEDYLNRTRSQIETQKTICSGLEQDVTAAELIAIPLNEAEQKAALILQQANSTVNDAIRDLANVEEEIRNAVTDPFTAGANAVVGSGFAVARGMQNIWYYIRSFFEFAGFATGIQRHLTANPGWTYWTAFVPSLKDMWGAVQEILATVRGTGAWDLAAYENLIAFTTKVWMLIMLLNLILLALQLVAPAMIAMYMFVVRNLRNCCYPGGSPNIDANTMKKAKLHNRATDEATRWKLASILLHYGARTASGFGAVALVVSNAIQFVGRWGSRIALVVGLVTALVGDCMAIYAAWYADATIAPATTMVQGVTQVMETGQSRISLALQGFLNFACHMVLTIPIIQMVRPNMFAKLRCWQHVYTTMTGVTLYTNVIDSTPGVGALLGVAALGMFGYWYKTPNEKAEQSAADRAAEERLRKMFRESFPSTTGPKTRARSRSRKGK